MLTKANVIQPDMVAWRRDFHMHPELGFEERRTAAKVAEFLETLGYRVRTGVGKTGVVAEIGSGSPVVGIRADMDALPIQEANQVDYRSEVPGVMHACGHDAHTAIALGTAKLLAQEDLSGTVRFLFQPSEEMEDDEGVSGAPRMVEDGAMAGVDTVLALHVDSATPTGEITIATEFASAGVDTFYAKVIGKGGHGSTPHKVVDPIFLSGYVILALHGIVSRQIRPYDPAVISIGSIQGGVTDNVIPEAVDMSGTIRYLDPAVQEKIHVEIEKALSVARSLGGDYALKIVVGFPPMNNHLGTVDLLRAVAGGLLGEEKITPPEPQMGAEDFAFFLKEAPGAMFMLGCEIPGDTRRHHDPRFDIDEACMPIGAAILAEATLRIMDAGNR